MKVLNLKMSISMLMGGLIVGFFLSIFVQGCISNATTANAATIAPETQKKELAEKVAKYEQKIADFEARNTDLQKQLKNARSHLSAAKAKVHQRETNIKKRIEPKGFPAKELLNKVRPALADEGGLSECDSLVKDIAVYIEENAVKDSLYEVQINTLDSIVGVKDSVIAEKTKLNKSLTEAFTKSLEQQETLLKENQQLRVKNKRQKRRSKLATLGLMILSALGGKQLSHH